MLCFGRALSCRKRVRRNNLRLFVFISQRRILPRHFMQEYESLEIEFKFTYIVWFFTSEVIKSKSWFYPLTQPHFVKINYECFSTIIIFRCNIYMINKNSMTIFRLQFTMYDNCHVHLKISFHQMSHPLLSFTILMDFFPCLFFFIEDFSLFPSK